jgi:transposase-like protein
VGNRSRKLELVHDAEPVRLGELIHDAVRVAIERIVREEIEAELGAAPYERAEVRHGYRNGTRQRTLDRPGRWR